MSDIFNSAQKKETIIDWDEQLIIAANKRDYGKLQEAVDNGANINVSNVRGITQMHAAVMSRNLQMVEWFASHGANPSLKTFAGDSALHDAAKLEDPDFLKSLLGARGCDVNVVNTLGSTPLMEAAAASRMDCVKLLLKAGAKVDIHSNQGSSALLMAATRHNYEMVKVLLGAGANPNDSDSYGVSALISAAGLMSLYSSGEDGAPQVASLKTMAELIKAGANANIPAKSGNTALAEASKCLNRRGMIYLLDVGANPNTHSTAGIGGEMTPLMMASYKHDVELIEKIVSKGGDVNFSNTKGQNALMIAMSVPIETEKGQVAARRSIETLLKSGAELSAGVKLKIGLAQYGVLTESKELMKLAQEKGVLDQPTEDGATAVFYAVAKRKMEMLEELHRLGAQVDCRNNEKQTVLHYLAGQPYPGQIMKAIELMKAQNDEKRKADAIKIEKETKQSAVDFTTKLIGYGVDINCQDKDGNTPLHCALKALSGGRVDRAYIDFLVEKGADISLRNDDADSPFTLAIKIGDADLAESWANQLIKSGKNHDVESSIYDVSWEAPELDAQVAAIKKVFTRLIPMGANVGYQDEDGQFALLIASMKNQEGLVNALIDLKADVHQTNAEGEVAAFHSVKENHPNITKILFDAGVDPNATRSDGESLMSIAYRDHLTHTVQQIKDARVIWFEKHPELAGEAKVIPAPKKMSM
jgi:serine/threonine-protein phosphatase 6 regulatory ankyrin repeat subunit B